MARSYDEKHLRFAFGDTWEVEKYDDHAVYKQQIHRLTGTRAVDFVGLNADVAYLIEVKDFRGHRIENTDRHGAALAEEVALKARDTVAGLVGGCRNSTTPAWWVSIVRAMTSANRQLIVLLWLEDDMACVGMKWKAMASVQTKLLKQKVSWLCARAFVVNQNTNDRLPPDVIVTNLPGAGQPAPISHIH